MSLDEQLVELFPEDRIEEEIIQADEYKENIYKALSKLKSTLSAALPRTGIVTTSPDPITSRLPTEPHRGARSSCPRCTLMAIR